MSTSNSVLDTFQSRVSENKIPWTVLFISLLILIPTMLIMWPGQHAEKTSIIQAEAYHSATVRAVDGSACDGITDSEMPCATLKVSIDGASEVPVMMTRGDYFSDVRIGDTVAIAEVKAEGGNYYAFHAVERTSGLLWLLGLTALIVIVVTGRKGLLALLSMTLAYLMFWFFLLPGISQGGNPLQYTIVTCAFIIVTVLYGTHGVSLKTTSALIGTVAGLLVAVLFGMTFSSLMSMNGVTSQTAPIMFQGGEIDLKTLAIAGLLVASIGILNDITVAQASTVWSISDHHPGDPVAVAKQALEVGKDHASSAIYTIAFSLVGASLGAMVIAGGQGMTLWAWLQDETVAETLLQVLVGAIGLVLSMPLTTLVAVYLRSRDKSGIQESGHIH